MKRNLVFLAIILTLGSTAFAQVSWQSTGKLPSGAVTSIMLDGTSGHMTIGINGGGVFRSSDGGTSWKECNTGLSCLLVKEMAKAPNGKLYAATNGGGIYRSEDGGSTWAEKNKGLKNYKMLALTIDSKGTIYCAGWFEGGVYSSTNEGETWTLLGMEDLDITAIAIASDGTLYAGVVGKGFYTSKDNGKKWSVTGLNNKDVYDIDILPDGSIAASTNDGLWLYKGSKWSMKKGGYVRSTVIPGGGTSFAFVKKGGLSASDEALTAWADLTGDLPDRDVFYAVVDNDNRIIVGTSEGVYKSNFKQTDEKLMISVQSVSKKSFEWGDQITFGITAKNKSGSLVSGVGIIVYDGFTEEKKVLQAVDGTANYVVQVPNGQANGDYVFVFTAGKDQFKPSDMAAKTIPVRHTVGVEDRIVDVSAEVYPNPFTDRVIVKSDAIASSEVRSASVFSMNGMETAAASYAPTPGGVDVSIPAELPPGVYMLVLRTNGGIISAKILKK